MSTPAVRLVLLLHLVILSTTAGPVSRQSRDPDEVGLQTEILVPDVACTTARDCYPRAVVNVSRDLISCVKGACLCLDCFTPNTTDGRCHILTPCFSFINGSCRDLRKSRTTALLLSIFLSSVGAANFYIDQPVLGGVQLAVFLLLVCVCCTPLFYMCCLLCYEDDCDECCCQACGTETQCVSCGCLMLVMGSLLIAVVIVWWVVDLTVFAFNVRDDGSECSLIA